jgi:hypothetical protein
MYNYCDLYISLALPWLFWILAVLKALFLYGWNITSKLQLDSANFNREAHIIITYTSINIIEAAHSVGFQCDKRTNFLQVWVITVHRAACQQHICNLACQCM